MKTKGLLFILLFNLSSYFLSAKETHKILPNGNSKIEIAQNFEVGKKYLYEVERGKFDSRNPASEKMKSLTNIEFNIIRSKGLSKECSWKYGTTQIVGVSSDQIDEQTKKILNIYKGIEIRFLIDKSGVIEEITNFEECQLHIENAFKLMYETSPKKIEPKQLEKILNAAKSSYSTPEILISTYCPELMVFFSMFGESIHPDSVYTSESDLPNPFGGRNFPTEVTTQVDKIENGIAMISVDQKIPAKELSSILDETFRKLAETAGKPFKEQEIPNMNVTVQSIYSFDQKLKILKEVSTEKIMLVEDIKQIQSLKITSKN